MIMQMDSGDVHWREGCRGYWCYKCNNITKYKYRCLNCEKKKLKNEKSMTINELVDKVKTFQKDKGFPTKVDLDNHQYLMFRNTLLLEEVSELFNAIISQNKAEIADGFADIIYIVIGTCAILDIPIDKVLEEVHRSNLTKDKGAVKGKKYERPRIKEILDEIYSKT